MESLVIDIVLAGLVVLFAWRGFRAGLINSVFGIITIIVAIYGANLIAQTYHDEFNGMLEPFITGVVDGVESEIVDFAYGYTDSNDFEPVLELDIEETRSVAPLCKSVLRQIGFSDGAAEILSQETAAEITAVGTEMTDKLTELLCGKLTYLVLFAMVFLLITIIFRVIGNVLDIAFGIPGLENVNHILGGVFGLVKGVIVIMVIASFCRYLGILLTDDVIDGTFILKKLVSSNAVASALNI